jgi:hypothetical protein
MACSARPCQRRGQHAEQLVRGVENPCSTHNYFLLPHELHRPKLMTALDGACGSIRRQVTRAVLVRGLLMMDSFERSVHRAHVRRMKFLLLKSHFCQPGFQMGTQQRLTTGEARLLILFRDATDLDLQLYELNKLRYRVRQAQMRCPAKQDQRSDRKLLRTTHRRKYDK